MSACGALKKYDLIYSFEKSIISHDADTTSSHAGAIAVAAAAICFNSWIFSDIVFTSFSTSRHVHKHLNLFRARHVGMPIRPDMHFE